MALHLVVGDLPLKVIGELSRSVVLSRKGNMADEELQYFERALPTWLHKFPDRIVLVQGNALYGVFDSEEDADYAGRALFRFRSFLVRRVTREQSNTEMQAN